VERGNRSNQAGRSYGADLPMKRSLSTNKLLLTELYLRGLTRISTLPSGHALCRMLLVAGGEIINQSGNASGGRTNASTLLPACQCPNTRASSGTPAND
jgi:hypothetical protein